MRVFLVAMAVFAAVIAFPHTGRAMREEPSFDCEKAETPIESLICDDIALVRLDAKLGRAFTASRDRVPEAARKPFVQQRCPAPSMRSRMASWSAVSRATARTRTECGCLAA